MKYQKNNIASNIGYRGSNISKRKDGRYQGRIQRNGKRLQITSKDIRVVQEWIEQQKLEEERERVLESMRDMGIVVSTTDKTPNCSSRSERLSPQMSLNEWFDIWIDEKENKNDKKLSPNTIRNNKERFYKNIQPVLGDISLGSIDRDKTKSVFVKMRNARNDNGEAVYKDSTMLQTYITLGSMLKAAVKRGLIDEVPLEQIGLEGHEKGKIRFMTVDEEKRFLEYAEGTTNYPQMKFVLETGLRCSEMIGLKWSDIDWNEEYPSITIKRQLEYRHSTKEWRWADAPKTKSGFRTILLSPEAVAILKEVRKKQEGLNTSKEFKDIIFLNKNGLPTKNSTYDTYIYKICKKAGIKQFSMHSLRHTFATRALGAGVSYKWLAQTLGHNNINTTISTYCHVADEFNRAEAEKVATFHQAKLQGGNETN